MRAGAGAAMMLTPWVRRLLIANVIVFLVSALVPEVYRLGMLVPAAILTRPWTLLTYMFLHAGLGHIFFNMLGLFFFGPRLELRLGSRDFALLYFLSGLGGAVLSFLFAPTAAVVGASGAVFGVLLGFARFWPTAPIYIWGVLPIQARWLVMITAALSLYSGFAGAQSGTAHFAHLGGFAAGWAYLKWRERRSEAFKRKATPGHTTTLERVSGKLDREVRHWRQKDLDSLHPINRQEYERVLRKVEVTGAGSLTAEERAFMNRMS